MQRLKGRCMRVTRSKSYTRCNLWKWWCLIIRITQDVVGHTRIVVFFFPSSLPIVSVILLYRVRGREGSIWGQALDQRVNVILSSLQLELLFGDPLCGLDLILHYRWCLLQEVAWKIFRTLSLLLLAPPALAHSRQFLPMLMLEQQISHLYLISIMSSIYRHESALMVQQQQKSK